MQACHAGIASARDLIPPEDPHPSLVLLTVKGHGELVDLSCRLTNAGLAHRVFFEEDMGGQATALAAGPVGRAGRRLFRELPLLDAAVG